MNDTTFEFMDAIKVAPNAARLNVLPVSVIEVGSSGALSIRGQADHDSDSSRAGFSPFPFEVAELCMGLYLRDSTQIVDPFAGWGERHEAARRHKMNYAGFDLSPAAIAHAEKTYGVKNQLADSRTVAVPAHDALITCPPYWNLEMYGSDNGLDRLTNWNHFCQQYRHVLSRFSDRACSGSFYCIVTGDWRSENRYYDLTFTTERIMADLGFVPHDKVVISRLGITKIKIMLPQAKRLKYTVKVHESLTVWKKI